MAKTLRVELLEQEDIDSIFEKTVHILATHGVKVDHEEALDRLAAAGAQVDRETRMVRFSRENVEAALKSVPSTVTVRGGDEKHDFTVPDPSGKIYSTTCVQTMRYLDPDVGDYVDNTHARFAEWCQLVEQLPNIHVCAIQTPMDAPPETADVHGLNVQLQNTSKPLMLLAYCYESVPYLFELMLARAGSAEALRKRPLLLINPTSLSPLVYKDMDMAQLLGAAEYDIPVAANSLPVLGATAPGTIAGTVLLAVRRASRLPRHVADVQARPARSSPRSSTRRWTWAPATRCSPAARRSSPAPRPPSSARTPSTYPWRPSR